MTPGPLLLAEPFEVLPGVTVFVVAYGATADDQALVVSDEHLEIAHLPLDSLTDADLPQVYRLAIARALA